MKKLVFWGSTRRRLKEFPEEARREAGHQLRNVQNGHDPDDWRPMVAICPGSREIRIHRPHEHRVIYIAQFPEAIYVLHVFEKKTQRTTQKDIDITRTVYAEIEAERQKPQKHSTNV